MRFFTIETKKATDLYGNDCQYRFHSLFNNAVGSWEITIDEARTQGEDHEKLIRAAYNIHDEIEGRSD